MSALTTTIIDNSSNNDDESDENNTMDIFEQFQKYRKKKASRKKCTNSLVCEATRLIEEIQRENGGEPKKHMTKNPAHGRGHWSQRKLHCKCTSQEEKERKPPKERTVKPSRLDFANQARALMVQPQKVEMLPPKDITKEST